MAAIPITTIIKNITQFAITGVYVDVNALTMTIQCQREDGSGNVYDTPSVVVTAAQFNAAWTGSIVTTIVALASASPKITT
jgi:hypothetical protein